MAKIIETLDELYEVNKYIGYFDCKPKVDALTIYCEEKNIDFLVYIRVLQDYAHNLNNLRLENPYPSDLKLHDYFNKYIKHLSKGTHDNHMKWANELDIDFTQYEWYVDKDIVFSDTYKLEKR